MNLGDLFFEGLAYGQRAADTERDQQGRPEQLFSELDQEPLGARFHSRTQSGSCAAVLYGIKESRGGLWVSWYEDGRLFLGPTPDCATTWAVRAQAELVADELGRHHEPLSFRVEEVEC